MQVTGEGLAAGRTLRELDLRGKTGATVLAVYGADRVRTNPSPDIALKAGHRLVALAEWALWKTHLNRLQWAGAALLLGGVLVLAWDEARSSLQCRDTETDVTDQRRCKIA